jgi:hypothetical protein
MKYQALLLTFVTALAVAGCNKGGPDNPTSGGGTSPSGMNSGTSGSAGGSPGSPPNAASPGTTSPGAAGGPAAGGTQQGQGGESK